MTYQRNTGLPKNQVRARTAELVKEKFVISPRRGFYAALPYKVEALVDSVPTPDGKSKPKV
jgi:hypothetical protein